MQENNFETIRSTWRRLSGEPQTHVESTTFVRMSGDTSDSQIFKKKEETDPLVSDKTKLPPALSDSLSSDIRKTGNTEEKQEFVKQDKLKKKDNGRDKVDSVYVHPPSPQKVRASATTADDEDCANQKQRLHCLQRTKEETDPLVSDKTKLPPAPSDNLSSDIGKTGNTEEKQEFVKQDKEAAGDSYGKDNNDDYLENKESLNKAPDVKWQKDNGCDKVDSVYVHPPSPQKVRASATTADDEDCGIKCLYYTLQCCDCVLM